MVVIGVPPLLLGLFVYANKNLRQASRGQRTEYELKGGRREAGFFTYLHSRSVAHVEVRIKAVFLIRI